MHVIRKYKFILYITYLFNLVLINFQRHFNIIYSLKDFYYRITIINPRRFVKIDFIPYIHNVRLIFIVSRCKIKAWAFIYFESLYFLLHIIKAIRSYIRGPGLFMRNSYVPWDLNYRKRVSTGWDTTTLNRELRRMQLWLRRPNRMLTERLCGTGTRDISRTW